MTELANKKLEYQGLFTDLEISVVKNLINEIRRQWTCLEKEDFDDLLQSCLVKWWTAKDKYNEKSDASLSTFMAVVIRNHLLNVKDNLLSDKRIIAEKSVSLDQPPDGDDELPALIERIPAPDLLAAIELKLNIKISISALSERQQVVCRLLGEEGLSMAAASRSLKISELTLYREIKRIRAVFEKQNLRDI
ncbi:MAG: sigma-70 family RNA polymerase sigma factor [Elusimicrobia bacterium]|nr:sigma-70 family RNA polymerase sigma factor [Elusimicrobiota bacterium]